MNNTNFSNEFLAAQVAGSCRLSGGSVSKDDEALLADIIAGKVDGIQLANDIAASYRAKNRHNLSKALF